MEESKIVTVQAVARSKPELLEVAGYKAETHPLLLVGLAEGFVSACSAGPCSGLRFPELVCCQYSI